LITIAVLSIGLGAALWGCWRWKQQADRLQGFNEELLLLVQGDALLLEGDHAAALEVYGTLAARCGDSTILGQRKMYINSLLAAGSETGAHQARTHLSGNGEGSDDISKGQGKDLNEVRAQQRREERQGPEPYGSHAARQSQELEVLRAELEMRKTKELLRFPSVKKGEEVVYVGEVKDGMAHGDGFGVWHSGSTYDGEWSENLRHGHGEFTWPDGERYAGQYMNDRRTGKGTYYWKNGQRWEGEWLDDMRHGSGTLYDTQGKVRVKGIWEKDKLVKNVRS